MEKKLYYKLPYFKYKYNFLNCNQSIKKNINIKYNLNN